MAVPYREFTQADDEIELLAAHCTDPDDNSYNLYTDWEDANDAPALKIGGKKNASGYELWCLNIRPDGDLVSGADVGCFAKITATMTLELNNPSLLTFRSTRGICNTVWHPTLVTGRYYDGSNIWATYPIYANKEYEVNVYGDTDVTVSALPKTLTVYCPACEAGAGKVFFGGDPTGSGYQYDDDLFDRGFWFRLSNYVNSGGDHFITSWSAGQEFSLYLTVFVARVYYFNPVVSAVSLTELSAAGGETIVLTGLGFDNADADIEEGSTVSHGAWVDDVYEIDFEGQEGQGTTTIKSADSDFTIDSNAQITLTTPALSEGTYHMVLYKNRTAGGRHETERIVKAYVGDWTLTGAEMVAGTRTIFTVAVGTEFGRRWSFIDSTPALQTLWKMSSFTGVLTGNLTLVNMQTESTIWTARITDDVLRLHTQVEVETGVRFVDSARAYAGIKAPAAYASSVDYKLPTADGTNLQALCTDGNAQLSWRSVGNVAGPLSSTDHALARWDGTNGRLLQDSSLILTDAGLLLLGETINTFMTIGLTLNQAANNDEILAMKSSSIAHGCTDFAETDTWGRTIKLNFTNGGLGLDGFGAGAVGAALRGYYGTDNTAKTTAALASVNIIGYKISGTGITNAAADQNILAVRTQRGGALTTVMIVDEDGDIYYDGALTNYDDFDDALACRDAKEMLSGGLRGFVKYNRKALEEMGVVSDGGFISNKGITALMLGAIAQLRERNDRLESQILLLQEARS